MITGILIFIISLLSAVLTFFSGFGLGTILLPTLSLFLPLEWAITATAMVHLLNNLVKMTLNYKNTNWKIGLVFITTAIPFALIGSNLFKWLYIQPSSLSFQIGSWNFETPLFKIFIGLMMILFAIFEWLPENKKPTFSSQWLLLGGALSGFFGGLSGHQGALRSAFFIRTEMTKNQIIATGIIVACCIDITRLFIYPIQWQWLMEGYYTHWIWLALLGATIGSLLGQFFIKKITIQTLKHFVAFGLLTLGIAMILGKV